jgi:hypothetical protein
VADDPLRGLHRHRTVLRAGLGGRGNRSLRPPINIDPNAPAMPISHPFVYAIYPGEDVGALPRRWGWPRTPGP